MYSYVGVDAAVLELYALKMQFSFDRFVYVQGWF